MFRRTMTVRFVLLMLLLGTASMFIGVEPWGPG
jgi:hypothetical protein